MSEQGKQEEKQEEKKELTASVIEAEFQDFLKEKGYELTLKSDEDVQNTPAKRKRIRKLSEDLNDDAFADLMYTDTTKLVPGMVVYAIEEHDTKPVVTYKPSARIICSIHDSGVNKGTVFITRVPKFIKNPDFKGFSSEDKKHEYLVVSEEEVIYSPLTKEQADRMCDLYNFQFKDAYKKGIKKVAAKLKAVQEAEKKVENINIENISNEKQK